MRNGQINHFCTFSTASLSNKPISYTVNGKLWEPRNFKPVPEHRLSLRDALARSINVATVDSGHAGVGLDRIVSTVKSFGFFTTLRPYPSLALGAFEVIPLELARAYCAFAADGVLPYPLSVKAVMDEKGRLLEQRHMTIERVISPARAFIMTSMLQSESFAQPPLLLNSGHCEEQSDVAILWIINMF